jgi:hypothetical protein
MEVNYLSFGELKNEIPYQQDFGTDRCDCDAFQRSFRRKSRQRSTERQHESH